MKSVLAPRRFSGRGGRMNGKEFDYSPEGCAFDEPVKAVDAASKDEVKPTT